MREESYTLQRAFGIRDLTRGQKRALRTQRKEVLWGGGLGAGKSWLGALWVIVMAMLNPGCTVLVVAQSAELHRHNLFPLVLGHLARFAQVNGWDLCVNVKLTMPFEVTIRGEQPSKILFVGQDYAETNRGPQYSAILIDELSKFTRPESVYEECLGRLRDPKARHRQLMVLTNLEHGETGVVRAFTRRVRLGDPHVDLILSATTENPTLPADYIESLRAQLSRSRFAALVEGKLIRPQSTVLPEFVRKRHVVQWPLSKCRNWPWAVALDWGLQSAALVGLVCRVAPDGELFPDSGAYAQQDWKRGLVYPDEVVDDALNTNEKLAHHVRSVLLPKWRSLTGQEPRVIVFDPAPGRHARDAVRYILEGTSGIAMWHYNQKDPDEKAAWPRAERLRDWLDPVEGSPRFFVTHEMSVRPSSADRGLATSLESLPRAKLRGDYQSAIAPGTPWEHIVDTAGYLAQWVDRESAPASAIPARLTPYR